MLRAKNISKKLVGFPKSPDVLTSERKNLFNKVNISIGKGDFYTLMGESGGGKSSLFRSLVFLTDICEGEIRWRDQLVEKNDIPNFRTKVQYVMANNFHWEGSVFNFLSEIRRYHVHKNIKSQQFRKELEDILDEIDFSKKILDQYASELSSGQKQIVHLLWPLYQRPIIYLLDEPTSAMDEKLFLSIEKFFIEKVNKKSCGVFWITHNKDQANRISRKQYYLEEGRFFSSNQPLHNLSPLGNDS